MKCQIDSQETKLTLNIKVYKMTKLIYVFNHYCSIIFATKLICI